MTAFLRNRPFLAIFLLALLVRLVNLVLLGPMPATFFAQDDAARYWEIGRLIVSTGQIAYDHNGWLEPATDVMPLYPLLLALVRWMFGDLPLVVVVIQALVDAGSCVAIAALVSMIGPAAGRVAGILAAFSLNLVIHSSQILTDTLFVFFISLLLLSGARYLREPLPRRALAAGIAAGLAMATRPVAGGLVLVGLLLIAGGAWYRGRRPWGIAALALLYALAAFGGIAPTLARNSLEFHQLSLTSQGGHHLALWIYPMVRQRADGTPFQQSVDEMQAAYEARLAARGMNARDSNDFQLSAIKSELAREKLAELPLSAYAKAWAEGMAVNLLSPAVMLDPRMRALPKPSFYQTPGMTLMERAEAYLFHDAGLYQKLVVAGLALTIPFFLLKIFGLALLARRHPGLALLAVGVLAYFLVVNGPVATPKYRLPMEPVLIALTALALVELWRWLCRRRPKIVS